MAETNPVKMAGARAAAPATAALACFACFVLAVALMHLLRPDYAPARHFISDYAVGRFGAVMTSAFVSLSAGCLFLMWGLGRGGPASSFAGIGRGFLGLAAAGLVVTAIFPTDLPGAPYTRSGDIHSASFLVNIGSLVAASLFLSLSFNGDPRWRPHRGAAFGLLAAVVMAFGLQFLSLQSRAVRAWVPVGLANRLFAGMLVAWLLATAARLRTIARG